MVLKQEHRLTPIGELRKHPRNPRRGDVSAIKASIRRNGFFGEVIAQVGTGYILAGNHRYEAAVESGFAELPVCWVECDERVALKILLADNRTADLGYFNDQKLADVLAELDQTEAALDGTGYTNDDYQSLLKSLEGTEAHEEATHVKPAVGDAGDPVKVAVGPYVFRVTWDSYQRLIANVNGDKPAAAKLFREKLGVACA